METPADKTLFDLRAGLRTEDAILNAAPGSTSAEENFHILIDGSRRRRRGLNLETNGETYELPTTFASTDVVSEGRWNNANGDPDTDFVVLQIGKYLHFYLDDGGVLSDGKRTETIDLSVYAVSGKEDDIQTNPVTMASGNSVLLCTGKFLSPIILEYDGTDITVTPIDLRERDFSRPDVGYSWSYQPTALSDAHRYNLRNAGWRTADITQYNTDESAYPALNMIWYFGYARQQDGVTYINEDGVKAWNSNRIAAEPFQNSPAPNGSLFVNPFDTTQAASTRDTEYAIDTWSVADTGVNPWVVTIETDSNHGLSPSDPVEIYGNVYRVRADDPEPGTSLPWTGDRSLDGEYTVQTAPTSTTFTINYTFSDEFVSFPDQYKELGSVLTGDPLTNPEGYTTDQRPRVCGWFAGRAWYGGVDHPELADHVFFSRLILDSNGYDDCYQINDPTSEAFSELLPDDGGVIVIPDMGKLVGMLEQQGSLILFSKNGVWEISGQRGVFAADAYNVRKITDAECTSEYGFVQAEGTTFFSGTKGIYTIIPDERTGTLFARSITEDSIQSAWNALPFACQKRAKLRYDDANKQLHVVVSENSNTPRVYTADFIYDLRLQTWHKLTFPSGVYGALAIEGADRSGQFKKIKYPVIQSDVLSICDLSGTAYTDFDGTESIPYITFNEFNEGDFQRYRHAPWVLTYMHKTETGFTEGFNNALDPVNESGLLLQAQWDFSDHENAGKWGTAQQVYRHRRAYTPASVSDEFDTGYALVVAKSKLRGRGRSLKLKLTGEAGKDAHIAGLALQYRVKRSI